MKKLYLLRHSISVGNEHNWYYGASDLPLSESGRELCRTLRGTYGLPEDTAFATSGMLRTEETLKILFGDVPHSIFPELSEMNFGKFEMHSYEELKDDADFQKWCYDEAFVIPDGESNLIFSARVQDCIRKLATLPTEHLCIVCHGGTIRRAMAFLFPESGKSFWDWGTEACHGYAISFEHGKAASYEAI